MDEMNIRLTLPLLSCSFRDFLFCFVFLFFVIQNNNFVTWLTCFATLSPPFLSNTQRSDSDNCSTQCSLNSVLFITFVANVDARLAVGCYHFTDFIWPYLCKSLPDVHFVRQIFVFILAYFFFTLFFPAWSPFLLHVCPLLFCFLSTDTS